MSDEKKKADDEESQKSGVRPAQVAAAALAAVTAAFLCSTLGVYGTVLGAGVLSVVTTLGSEVYMRSLEKTRAAARVLSGAGARVGRPGREREGRSGGSTDPDRTVYLAAPTREQWAEHAAAWERTRVLNSVGREDDAKARRVWWKRRWPVVAATSALAFVVGMLVVTGYEGVTGRALSGDDGTTVGSIVRSGDTTGTDHEGRDVGPERRPGEDASVPAPSEDESTTEGRDGRPEDTGERDEDRPMSTAPEPEQPSDQRPEEPEGTQQPEEPTPSDTPAPGAGDDAEPTPGGPAGRNAPAPTN